MTSTGSVNDLKVLLSKLEGVPDIDDHWINVFLVKASELDAGTVVGILLGRIRKEHDGKSRCDALPILGFRDPLVGWPRAQTKRGFYERYVTPRWSKGDLSGTGYPSCSEKSLQVSSLLQA